MTLDFAELLLQYPDYKLSPNNTTGDGLDWHAVFTKGEYSIAIDFYNDRSLKYVHFYTKWWLHRPSIEGPAKIRYYENGQVNYVEFYDNGRIYRPCEEGPAEITYDNTGCIHYEVFHDWRKNAKT